MDVVKEERDLLSAGNRRPDLPAYSYVIVPTVPIEYEGKFRNRIDI